jgi:hypothetical protein
MRLIRWLISLLFGLKDKRGSGLSDSNGDPIT